MEAGISVNEVFSSRASKYPTVSTEKLRVLKATWAVIWLYPAVLPHTDPLALVKAGGHPLWIWLHFSLPLLCNCAPLSQLGQHRSRDTASSVTFSCKSIQRFWTWDEWELQNLSPPSLPSTSTCRTLTSLFTPFWFSHWILFSQHCIQQGA